MSGPIVSVYFTLLLLNLSKINDDDDDDDDRKSMNAQLTASNIRLFSKRFNCLIQQ